MKHPLARITTAFATIFATWSLTHCAFAQDAIPFDEAQRIAQKLASTPSASSDQPFTVEADADKPVGLKGGDAGVIILPDKRLTVETFAHATKTITPVAQLWSYKVNLTSNGKSVESGKLRVITVSDGDKSRDVQLFLIGVAKNEQGALELVVFGKGSDPILRAPLAKLHETKQDFPIEVSGRKTGDDSAALTLDLVGGYTADLAVVKAGD